MGLSVLVVDDEEMIRVSLALLLTVKGYNVVTAPDTATALDMLQVSRPDVVISDMIMPGGQGLDAIRAIRRLNPDVKIVAMSGGGRLGNSNILSVASGFGADACLEKPFEPDDLLQLLCQY
ncbi:MAG: response regulator [Sphingomonas sp.]|jgi:CheY-like chemotaxis protein|uniref:response regulator n=1 Tax=Sphingomonas sp. TaxID=28214 RepID=UPI003567438C